MDSASGIRTSSARYPLYVEIQYARVLRRLVADIETFALAEIKLEGPAMIAAADADYGRKDALLSYLTQTAGGFVAMLSRMLDRIAQGITSSLLGTLDQIQTIRANADAAHRREWTRQLKEAYGQLSVNILNNEPDMSRLLSAWEQQNIALIKTIPPNIVEQLRTQFTEAFVNGTTMRDLSYIVRERADVGRSRAALIARDQIGKLNGQLSAFRQRAAGVDSYVWRTMRDERVRPTHRIRDGKTYRWADDGIKPGQEILCRCVADPVFPHFDLNASQGIKK